MKRVRNRKSDVGDGGWGCWTAGTKIGWDSQVRRDVQRIRETPGEQQHTRSQLVVDGPTEEGGLVTRTQDGDQDRWAKGTPRPREKGTGGIPLPMVTKQEKRASDSILRSPTRARTERGAKPGPVKKTAIDHNHQHAAPQKRKRPTRGKKNRHSPSKKRGNSERRIQSRVRVRIDRRIDPSGSSEAVEGVERSGAHETDQRKEAYLSYGMVVKRAEPCPS